MSSTETVAPSRISGGRAAAGLGMAMLGGLTVLLIFARSDRANVDALEGFREVTAVGDHHYYALPDPLPNPPLAVAHFEGRALLPAGYEKVDARDTKMERLGHDSGSGLTIYRPREPLPAGSTLGQDYFIKTAANEYLRLRPTAPGP